MIDCSPQIHVAAIHAEAEYRSFVPGLAILCIKDNTDIVSVGTYQNSIGAQSLYAVRGQYMAQIGSVHFGMVGGIVNGYPAGNGHFIPMLAGIASFDLEGVKTHLTLVPPVPNYTPGVIQFSFSF